MKTEFFTKRDFAIILNEVIQRFIHTEIDKHKISDTGKMRNSLESREVTSTETELWGVDYAYYAISGRSGGKGPKSQDLIGWVQRKFGVSGKQAEGMAYVIARKIAKEGTDRNKEKINLSEILNSQEVRQYIIERVTQIMNKNVTDHIQSQLKKLKIK